MKLSKFITENLEDILREWAAFAQTLQPRTEVMPDKELRDHAQQMLESIARDLGTAQTDASRDKKSKGLAPAKAGGGSAAALHGAGRGASGFTLVQLVAEFRALRASVLKLWLEKEKEFGAETTGDLMRFNEAMDQAVSESVANFEVHNARTRDTFLAMLGHDLRSPLASIAAAGDFLLRPEARNGNISLMGERVKRGASNMSAMVNDLLEYARSQLSGTMPVNPQASDLNAVALASLQDSGASHPDCPFELEVEGDLEGEFDALRVQQVVTNLLTNAAQYRDKHYCVTLSLSGQPEHLVIRVKNRGPVIPGTAVEAIFNPMVQLVQQGDSDVSRPRTSMGLGLFIAREITEAHGGTIAVASTEKEGTIFTVTLPRKTQAKRAASS